MIYDSTKLMIDLDAIDHNIQAVKDRACAPVMAIIKADAYGHGAVELARHFGQGLPFIGAAAGVACVLGHMFPFFLRFRGGKGFASYLGMTLALNWKFALLVMVIVALVTFISDYIVVGTVTTVVLVPAYMAFTHGLYFSAILCIATAAILIKHRENYVRIYRGTEIGLRKANRGEHRKV